MAVAADGKELITYDLEVPLPEIAKRLVNEGLNFSSWAVTRPRTVF